MSGFVMIMAAQAKRGDYDPLFGRDREVNRVFAILSRKTKNNPILLGEAGVGNTAIIEGFAQQLMNKDVPKDLIRFPVIFLDLVSLIAGAKYRGELAKRVETIRRDLVRSNRKGIKKIIFRNEIHICNRGR